MPETLPGNRRWIRWVLFAAIVLATAWVLRSCVVTAYRIPTTSMERGLQVGDYVLVSKIHYGPRMWNEVRGSGFGRIRRGDVIVFNHPGESGPIYERTVFVKRAVAIPGDTLRIENRNVLVNGLAAPELEGEVQDWALRLVEGRLPDDIVESPLRVIERMGLSAWRVRGTRLEIERLRELPGVHAIDPAESRADGALWPPGGTDSPDSYGPVIVPSQNTVYSISDENWPAFRELLQRENRTARRIGSGEYEIDGANTATVQFSNNYYFVLGDNRGDSADSRRWGLVPENHVIGKAVLIYASRNEATGGFRWERFLKPVR